MTRILRTGRERYEIESSADSRGVLPRIRQFNPHAVIVGNAFRGGPSGPEICTRMRRMEEHRDAGVLVVADRMKSGQEHKVILRGADLCLHAEGLRPDVLRENIRELLDAVHERRGLMLQLGALRACTDRRIAWLSDKELEISPMQFDVLARLLRQPMRTLGPRELLGYGDAINGVAARRVARVHICRLRSELGSPTELIETVRGRGYRLRLPEDLPPQDG